MAMALATAYEMSLSGDGTLRDALFRVGAGVVILAGAVFELWRLEPGSGVVRRLGPGFVAVWALAWLAFAVPWAWRDVHQTRALLALYRSGKAEVAEGEVTVLHTQPRSGHTSGDRIRVDGQEFEVNYFEAGPGYHRTLAYGGVLDAGVHARLYHHDGIIIAVQVPPAALH